ncbi:TPA: hypothetical protein QCR58_004900 [Bacillus cereus]|uniref:hypothetical protein n=1 Tax=Bacillus thuringiensis TaxID=1428 RepID=UPI000BF4F41B|nr:hypothetical protein [Bacillus thuringiensis]EKS7846827.1 hypothetical protein [Bacillus cereus]PEZ22667.1 hypothetical protein CN345_28910 [Bacillus thuringiensis]PFE66070.1 hypothetical protein CN322_03125 [Bacillus thuringiensis]PGY38934.1 hypothetical protein COE09_27820 [Bacillus thuringiensis]HDR4545456.1 hypothetical protein [Bacillus cereus]
MNAQQKVAQMKLERRFKEFNEKIDRMNKQLEGDKRAFAEQKKANEQAKFQKEYDEYLISIGKKEKPIEMSKEDRAYYDKYMASLGLGQRKK